MENITNVKDLIEKEKYTPIPDDFNYDMINGLTIDDKIKINLIKPFEIGQLCDVLKISPKLIKEIIIAIKKKK